MDDARWHEIDTLFEEALEVEQDRRGAFLRQKCGDDEKLRHAVERLLALEVEAEGFLEKPVRVRPAEPSGVLDGMRVGPYRLLRALGHGGMGSVYLARREDDYRQEVAVKLVRRGLMSEETRRRFRKERQILARLEHPNVARLYDGGTTSDGHPYLVMERVEGLPIDRFCDEHRLTVRECLELFRQVCAAVSYAHSHHLAHCDLKPSNILVTAEGTPKLLDFGIAKRLGSEDHETTWTLRGVRPVTPGYASPEQVSGEPITAVSDVYSLGVLLYKLLCGCLPYPTAAKTYLEIESMILERTPEKPSRRVFEPLVLPEGEVGPEDLGRRRAATPQDLARQLRGNLDAIVLKALEKDPARRYVTVEELSDDVAAHLELRPVNARHDVRSHRAARLLHRLVLPPDPGRRRERLFWAALAGTLAVASIFVATRPPSSTAETETSPVRSRDLGAPLGGGISLLSVESHLADARAASERSEYRTQLHAARRAFNAAHGEGDEVSKAQALVLEAQALDVLAEPTEADRALEAACRIFKRLGDRLGLAHATFALRNTKDFRRLPMSFEEALAVFRERGDRGGEALALVRLGKAVPAEERERGEAMVLAALAMAEELGDLRIQAEAWSSLASLSVGREDLRLADERFAQAVLVAQNSGDASLEAGFMLSRAWTCRQLGDMATHDDLVEQSVEIARRIDHRYLLVMGLPELARVRLRQGDDNVEGLYDEAARIAFEISDPRTVTLALRGLASDLERRGEYGPALELRERILEICRHVGASEFAAHTELELAWNLARLGRATEAEQRIRALAGQYPIDDKTYEYTPLLVQLKLAEIVLERGEDEEAQAILAGALPRVITKDEVELHRLAARLAAETDAACGTTALAELLALEESRAEAEGDTERVLRIRLDLGRLEWYSGEESGARERFKQVQRDAAELGDDDLVGVAAREAEELSRLRSEEL